VTGPQPIVQPVVAAAPAAAPAAASEPEPVATPERPAASAETVRAQDTEAGGDLEKSAAMERARSKPLRGYAWSPERKRLVPASAATDEASPAPRTHEFDSEPATIPTDEPAVAAPKTTTNPARFEARSKATTDKAPIIE